MPTWRTTDPETSRIAAQSIDVHRLTETQNTILTLLTTGEMTDEMLIDRYNQWRDFIGASMSSPSGIRSRRAELVDAGLVKDSGLRLHSIKSHRMMIVWQAV